MPAQNALAWPSRNRAPRMAAKSIGTVTAMVRPAQSGEAKRMAAVPKAAHKTAPNSAVREKRKTWALEVG